jgi:hypothetical protein
MSLYTNRSIIRAVAGISLVCNLIMLALMSNGLMRNYNHVVWQHSYDLMLCVFLVVLFIPIMYIWQVLLLINNNFPDKEITRLKMNSIRVLFFFQLASVLLDILFFVALIASFSDQERLITKAKHPYPLQNLLILIIFFTLIPLNTLIAFMGKGLSRAIHNNYNNGLFNDPDPIT